MKKNLNKTQKKKVLAAAGTFAAVAALSATFAWFTSEDSKTNHFEGEIATGKDIEIVETFEPPTDWEPGSEVNKDVQVANIGKYDALIRVGLDESLQLLDDHVAKQTTTGTELNGLTEEQAYVVPGSLPTGYTDSTFAGAAPTITITGGDYAGTYTLKVVEKSETHPTTGVITYSYRQVWDNGTQQFHATGIAGYDRNETTGQITLKAGSAAAMSYVDLTYAPAITRDWTVPTIYNPTPAFANGNNDVLTSLEVTPGTQHPIELLFNNITTDPTVADKWYFNTADGYFYYTSVVAPGALTTQLLDAVTLLGSAGNEYSKLQYDLTVNAKGISAFKDAVDEWLPAGGPLATALKDLVPEK
ncbi:BsaA family SipW-dependent biofilm matrix protein [Candidatus Enterococcus clewellii]|uniref:Alternate signal-mediated exported protein n=1 Tax=Candidatus Enterococcus clewellii TaxID=1834193 RepID=A0A242K5A6_9ENTE|nr:BsaA family SipW-dependent biofilm matrix protein [Enterococcus sp. 9E7_DIV0242]OTP14625.1 hypothetical protein A5888_002726 [Enterococcus sp. 9E7_DIV0242]